MMSEHTKGKWHIFDNRNNLDGIVNQSSIIGVGVDISEDVAYCNLGFDRSDKEKLANARLIAAAPELLAELEQLVRTVEMMGDRIPVNVGVSILSSKEIIAKATGEA
jgi:hypothetical protein